MPFPTYTWHATRRPSATATTSRRT
jgi:hypothetical protein